MSLRQLCGKTTVLMHQTLKQQLYTQTVPVRRGKTTHVKIQVSWILENYGFVVFRLENLKISEIQMPLIPSILGKRY